MTIGTNGRPGGEEGDGNAEFRRLDAAYYIIKTMERDRKYSGEDSKLQQL
jgi:hypothetical protein